MMQSKREESRRFQSIGFVHVAWAALATLAAVLAVPTAHAASQPVGLAPRTGSGMTSAPESAMPSHYGVFLEPLIAFSTPRAGDETRLLAAIETYRRAAEAAAGDPDAWARVQPLEAYLAANPDSPWRVSLLTNIGLVYERLGYVQDALEAFAHAVELANKTPVPPDRMDAKGQLDGVLAEQLELHARLGHLERAQALLADPRIEALRGVAYVKATEARLVVQDMADDPAHAMRCGWVALGQLLRARGAGEPLLSQVRQQTSHANGMSLGELAAWASSAGTGLVAVHLAPGQSLPVPSLAHLKAGHFVAVVEARGSGQSRQVRLMDSVLGPDRWISAHALQQESSGYYLADATAVVGTKKASAQELQGLTGAGNPGDWDHNSGSPQDSNSGGDSSSDPGGASGYDGGQDLNGSGPVDGSGNASACLPCTQSAGMPTYSVQSLNVGLTIHDTPLSYTPAVGPRIDFLIYYSQNDQLQAPSPNFSNLGPLWTHNWLAYITDDPTNIGTGVTIYKRGGGGYAYSGYNAGDGTFAREPRAAQLVLASVSPVQYVRDFPDGSQEVYAQSDVVTANKRYVLLSQVIDAQGNAVSLVYDSTNRLQKIVDAVGQATTFGYGNAANPLLITKISEPFPTVPSASLGYTNGYLSSVSDTLPTNSSFGYNPNGSGVITSMTTPYGTTQFNSQVISKYERWIEITDPLGYIERVEYNSGGLTPNDIPDPSQTPAGMSVAATNMNLRDTFYFDKVAYPLAKGTGPNGGFEYKLATTIKHWAEMNVDNPIVAPVLLATTKSPELASGIWEWYLYPNMANGGGQKTVGTQWYLDASGRVLPDGSTRKGSSTYNDLGHITTYTDPMGRTTTYLYAPNQIDLLSVTQSAQGQTPELIYQASNYVLHEPQNVTDASGQPWTYTYNGAGQIQTVQNPLKQTTTYNYNSAHQLINIVNADQLVQVKFGYDANGRVQTVTDSEGYQKTIGYDNLNRVTSVTYPDQTADLTNYDLPNRPLDIRSVVNRLGQTTTFWHDADRRLYKVQDNRSVVTQYAYDFDGHLTKFTDANKHPTSWTPDADGRVHIKAYPSGEGYSINYDSAGREWTRTDSKGQTRTILYYADGTIQNISYTGNTTNNQSYTYDPLYPRLKKMLNQGTGVHTSFGYVPAGTNGAGQLLQESSDDPNAISISYSYDKLSRPKTRAVGTFNETWNYDQIGRLQTDTNALGQFTYTYLGETPQPRTETLANAAWATQWNWQTNQNDRMLHSITHTLTASSAHARFDWTRQMAAWLGWSSAANVPEAAAASADSIIYSTQTGQITGRTQGADVWNYGYDGVQRLKSAGYTGTGAGQGAQYTYDDADFLSQIATTNPATTTNFVPNKDNQVASENGSTNASWVYDPTGNVTDDGVNTYTWDVENRVTKITRKSDGHTSSFGYDGLGRRMVIKEQDAGGNTATIELAWCQGSPTPCAASLGASTMAFLAQGEFNSTSSPAAIYYARDHQGSVMQTVDSAGNLLASRSYGEYGRLYNTSGSSAPSMGYAGMFLHAATGLYLTQNRVYSSVNGRWLSRDPAGEAGGSNLYAMDLGNPIARTDPMGLASYVICHVAAAPLGYVTSPTSFHCAIEVIPEDPTTLGGIHSMTLGGQESGGKLVYAPNYPGDSPTNADTVAKIQIPCPQSDKQFIRNLVSAASSYDNKTPYSLPTDLSGAMPPGTYNSNSFVSGVIRAAGGVPPKLPYNNWQAPGYSNPLPISP
jgi:RHS repeat-associated protein